MEKQKNIPALRFPEFTEEWERKRLGDIAQINPRNESLPVSFIYIDLESVVKGELIKEQIIERINAPSRAQRLLRKGDVLFQMVRPYQKNNFYFDKDGSFVASTGYAQLRTNHSSKFIFQYLHIQKFVDKVIENCTGTSYPAINSTDLANLYLIIPNLPEQNKIASFLNAVDDKLQALKKKKSLLEQYKKGVMQKIFSQEIRFKDDNGDDFSEWEIKSLGEVCENIVSGKTKAELEGNYPVFGSTGIIGKSSFYTHNGVFLLIARVGANAGFVHKVKGKFSVTDNTLIVHNKSTTHIDFIYHFLLNFNLNRFVFGSGQPLITGSQLKSMQIRFPLLNEQTKIANFLSAIDEKINHCQTQIEKTEQYKKGLLQQMFC